MKIRIGLVQLNPNIGAFDTNYKKILNFIRKAEERYIDILIFPEMVITGYPPQDLLFNRSFVDKNLECLNKVAKEVSEKLYVIIGFVDKKDGKLYNSAAVLNNGKILEVRSKTLLPNYDVFDEVRYFTPANENDPFDIYFGDRKLTIGVEVCEDLWDKHYDKKVTDELYKRGAELVINISASPFTENKFDTRLNLIKEKVKKYKRPFILTNMVGSNSELVFDGNSIVMDCKGKIIGWGGEFVETLEIFDLDIDSFTGIEKKINVSERIGRIYKALIVGIHDYLHKTGFYKAVVGLSGGIDSSVVASLASEALGAENVLGVLMPSRYTSERSIEDAKTVATNLGIEYKIIPIEDIFQSYKASLSEMLLGLKEDITEENIQARIRGNILMAISNKFGYMVLSTGNKTEMALGYCTLYGDLSGGLAVISDINKLDVYELGRYFNKIKGGDIIPESVFTKKPTAELKFDQVDPFDYNIVSPLTDEIIESGRSVDELVEMGYDRELVVDIVKKIRKSEYKRRQAPPGIKITEKAFGMGRRYPIVNYFDG